MTEITAHDLVNLPFGEASQVLDEMEAADRAEERTKRSVGTGKSGPLWSVTVLPESGVAESFNIHAPSTRRAMTIALGKMEHRPAHEGGQVSVRVERA